MRIIGCTVGIYIYIGVIRCTVKLIYTTEEQLVLGWAVSTLGVTVFV